MVSAFLGDAPAGGATGGGGKKHGGGAVEWTGEAAKGQAGKWVDRRIAIGGGGGE